MVDTVGVVVVVSFGELRTLNANKIKDFALFKLKPKDINRTL